MGHPLNNIESLDLPRYQELVLKNFNITYFKVLSHVMTKVQNFKSQISRLMMMSSNGNIFRVTGPLCREFTGSGQFPAQRPVTGSFNVFFDLRLNKRFSKQPWGWWFETPLWSLWRQCNAHRQAMACLLLLFCEVKKITVIMRPHFIIV